MQAISRDDARSATQYPPKRSKRSVSARVVYLSMEDRAYTLWTNGKHQDVLAELFTVFGGRGPLDIKDDDVRRDLIQINMGVSAGPYDLSESSGAPVVIGETGYMVLQGEEPSGRDDAGLAHSATQHLSISMGQVDALLGTAEERANRGAQPLGETDGDRV